MKALLLLLFLAGPLCAHWADLAVMDVSVRPDGTRVTLTIPGGLIPVADVNGDGHVSPAEAGQRTSQIASALSTKLVLVVPGKPPVPFRVKSAGPAAAKLDPRIASDLPGESHLTLKLEFDPAPLEGLRFRYDLWVADAPQASCFATILRGATFANHVFTPRDREIAVGEPLAAGMPARGSRDATKRPLAALGLIALLLAGGSAGGILLAGTLFLAACGVGLALAGLDVVHVPNALAGALAAGSVALLALLCLWPGGAGDRVAVALAAGLVHGVYLSHALKARVPADEIRAILPLYEAGALATLAATAALAAALGHSLDRPEARPLRLLVGALAAAGAIAFRPWAH